MNIEIFTLCDYAQSNNNKLTIVGTFDSFNAEKFPFTHPFFSIVARIRYNQDEIKEKKYFKILEFLIVR